MTPASRNTRMTLGQAESFTQGWKGKTTLVPIRIGAKEVGHIVGRESPGTPGWMMWSIQFPGKPKIDCPSLQEARQLVLNGEVEPP